MVSFGRLALISFQSSIVRRSTCPTVVTTLRLPVALTFAGLSLASHRSTQHCQLMSSCSPNTSIETGYLNAKDAYDLDQDLFDNGYTLE